MARVKREDWSALTIRLLGRTEIRHLAREIDFRPRKSFGQNFVHDANTVRRIVSASGVNRHDHVLEVGPGLGSLTLALLDRAEVLIERAPITPSGSAPEVAEQPTMTATSTAPSESPGSVRRGAGVRPSIDRLIPAGYGRIAAPMSRVAVGSARFRCQTWGALEL